jgi:hypothetical protein
MREILTLNVAMLEPAESKVTGHGNDALVETICETIYNYLNKYEWVRVPLGRRHARA